MSELGANDRVEGKAAAMTVCADGSVVAAIAGKPGSLRRWPNAEAFAGAVRRRAVRVRRWAIVVPREECLVKQVTLPTCDENEAATMLSFEVPELFPVGSEEAHYDAVTIDTDGDDQMRIAVWLLLEANLHRHLEVLTAAGVEPAAIVPSSLGFRWWVQRNENDERPGRRLLIAAEAGDYEVLLYESDRLLWSRRVRLPDSQGPDVVLIISEALRVDLESDADAMSALGDIARVLVLGRDDEASVLREQLAELIRQAGVSDGPGIEVVERPAEQDAPATLTDLCLAGVARDLAEGVTSRPNMLPARLLESRGRRRRRTQLGASAALAGLAAALFWGYLSLGTWRLERQHDRLQAAIAPIKDVATELERKKQQLRAVQDQLGNRDLPLRIIAELYRHVPGQTSLSDVTIVMRRGGAEVVLRGLAPAVHSAYELPEHLARSELLRRVQVVRADSVGDDSGRATFECHAEVGG